MIPKLFEKMKIQEEDDKIKMKTSAPKQYISLNQNENKYLKFISIFAFLFLFIIVFLFVVRIENKNKQLKTVLSRKSIESEEVEKKLYEKLQAILEKDKILQNEMMKKHTTFEIGGPAKFFVKPQSINQIIKIINLVVQPFTFSFNFF